MSAENNLPDWLKQLRDQQMGGPDQPAPEPPPDPWANQEPVEPPADLAPSARADGLDALREIASAEPMVVEEPRRQINIPIVNQLTPFQRFVLALMLFLNVSVLGCLFLMVTEKISFVR